MAQSQTPVAHLPSHCATVQKHPWVAHLLAAICEQFCHLLQGCLRYAKASELEDDKIVLYAVKSTGKTWGENFSEAIEGATQLIVQGGEQSFTAPPFPEAMLGVAYEMAHL